MAKHFYTDLLISGAIQINGSPALTLSGVDAQYSLNVDSTLTYVSGNLTRINYTDGQSKILTYNADGSLAQLVWDRGNDTVTKVFNYISGALVGIDVTIN